MNLQTLHTIIDARQTLRGVYYHALEALPAELWLLELALSAATLLVGVDEDTDAVVLVERIPAVDDDNVSRRDVSAQVPWRSMIGLPVLWAWQIRNHQGYTDGLQLEFADPERGSGPTVQVIGLASSLTVRVVTLVAGADGEP